MRNKTLICSIVLNVLTACAVEAPRDATLVQSAMTANTDALVITEVMRNPAAVRDSRGEWFEVHNAGSTPVDLNGVEVRDSRGTGFVIDDDIVLEPSDHAVIARNRDSQVNGGVAADYDWSGSFSLANGGDDIELWRGDTLLDRVDFREGAVAGVSESLSAARISADGNDDADAWCLADIAYGDGDLGTPGEPNGFCGDEVRSITDLEQGDLAITEIMRNPDAVSDANGEWFEVQNTTGFAIDLQGLAVRDDRGRSFAVETTLVVPAGAYVVFGRNADVGTNGGVAVDYAWDTSLVLANGADDLQLWADETLVDDVAWDDGTLWDDPVGASIQLGDDADPDLNDFASEWCVSTEGYGLGDLGTPGSANGSCERACDFGLSPGESIQDAIDAAVDGDVICLDMGIFQESIDFAGKDLTVRGAGVADTRIEAQGMDSGVRFAGGETADAVLEHLTIWHGRAARGGSVFIDGASPTVRHVDISENWCLNQQDCRGTAIYIHESSATLTDINVENSGIDNSTVPGNNPADIWGGLVFVDQSDVALRNMSFDNTQLEPYYTYGSGGQHVEGGIIFAARGSLSLDNVHINGTMIDGREWGDDIYGGILYAHNGGHVTANNLRITGVELAGNNVHGGILYADAWSNVRITNGILSGVDALWTANKIWGGVVHVASDAGQVELTNVTFSDNAALHVDGGETKGDTIYMNCNGTGRLSMVNVDTYWNGTIHEERFQTEGDWDDCADKVSARYVNVRDPSNWRGFDIDGIDGYISEEVEYSWPSNTIDWWFTLPAGSGLIDAGDPSILDADGSRSDIGAHGGPGAANW